MEQTEIINLDSRDAAGFIALPASARKLWNKHLAKVLRVAFARVALNQFFGKRIALAAVAIVDADGAISFRGIDVVKQVSIPRITSMKLVCAKPIEFYRWGMRLDLAWEYVNEHDVSGRSELGSLDMNFCGHWMLYLSTGTNVGGSYAQLCAGN